MSMAVIVPTFAQGPVRSGCPAARVVALAGAGRNHRSRGPVRRRARTGACPRISGGEGALLGCSASVQAAAVIAASWRPHATTPSALTTIRGRSMQTFLAKADGAVRSAARCRRDRGVHLAQGRAGNREKPARAGCRQFRRLRSCHPRCGLSLGPRISGPAGRLRSGRVRPVAPVVRGRLEDCSRRRNCGSSTTRTGCTITRRRSRPVR